MSDIPSGWYPDPYNKQLQRYRDDSKWSHYVFDPYSGVVLEKSRALRQVNLIVVGLTVLLALSAPYFLHLINSNMVCPDGCSDGSAGNPVLGVVGLFIGVVILLSYLYALFIVVAAYHGVTRVGKSAENWTTLAMFLLFPYLLTFALAWYWVLVNR